MARSIIVGMLVGLAGCGADDAATTDAANDAALDARPGDAAIDARPDVLATTGCTARRADGDREVCVFTASGTFTIVSGSAPIEIFVVGGGGSGGRDGGVGGGGGAGGFIHLPEDQPFGPGAYPVVVGAGGQHGAVPQRGGDSSFADNVADGGGAGDGGDGGSGGGGGGPAALTPGGQGNPSQGHKAGDGHPTDGGGGGGAAANGVSGIARGGGNGDGGNGGNGEPIAAITGQPVFYACGGGGADGGTGGKGLAGCLTAGIGGSLGSPGIDAQPNSGGGGGGGSNAAGGNGGSGIVVLRYRVR